MDHKEENCGNPEYIQNCLLCSISNTIRTNIELSKCNLPSVRKTSHHGVVSNFFKDVSCRRSIIEIELQLVLSKLIETDTEWEHEDAENDDEPEYVLEDKEDNGYNVGDLINDLHKVQRFRANNNGQEAHRLSHCSYGNQLVIFMEPVLVGWDQSDRDNEVQDEVYNFEVGPLWLEVCLWNQVCVYANESERVKWWNQVQNCWKVFDWRLRINWNHDSCRENC